MNVDGRGSEPQRWIKGECPNPGGRPSVRWLKELIETEDPETGICKRQIIAKHLIELATSYTVIVAGRDLELASGRDSIEAAKILFSYCYGKPPPSCEELTINLAEHFREVARDSVDVALKVLGDRIKVMPPKAVAEALQAFAVNPRGFIKAAEAHVGVRSPVEGESRAFDQPGSRRKLDDRSESMEVPGADSASESQGARVPPEPETADGEDGDE